MFETALERIRKRFQWAVLGYVVMPEHVHLLANEPRPALLSTAIQALKLSVVRRRPERPFWQERYYDFNLHSADKTTEKLRYIHRNPVNRGLVTKPEDWLWSSFNHYKTGVEGRVEIESFWTQWRREHGGKLLDRTTVPVECPRYPGSQNRDPGHPNVNAKSASQDPGHPPFTTRRTGLKRRTPQLNKTLAATCGRRPIPRRLR